MYKKGLFVLGLSLLSLILISCIFEADKEDFSFEISVKDTAGNPVEGLNVALVNNIGDYANERVSHKSRAHTTISFELGIAAHCSIIIKDIKKKIVRNLISEEMNAGSYHVNWNGKNDDDLDLPSGLYYCQMAAMNDDEMFYKENHAMYLQSYRNKYGHTDASGSFKMGDKKPFLNLFKTDSLKIVSEDGYVQGNESFSQTTVVCLYEGNNPQFIQMENVIVKNKKNRFEIIWDPENSVKKVLMQNDAEIQDILSRLTRDAEDDLIPTDDAQLRGSYPNPFN